MPKRAAVKQRERSLGPDSRESDYYDTLQMPVSRGAKSALTSPVPGEMTDPNAWFDTSAAASSNADDDAARRMSAGLGRDEMAIVLQPTPPTRRRATAIPKPK